MTYRNYRNQLHRQMISYLRFMKHADTDKQLLELHTEVNLLRNEIAFYDQFTASQMLQKVNFTDEVFESYGLIGVPIVV